VTGLVPALLVAVAAQAPPEPPTFAAGVEAVYVDVFVTDGAKAVTGLGERDFELRDDGRPQKLELVAVESLPLRSFLVLDTSGSVDGPKLAQLQAAGLALLRGLRGGDEAALVTFGHEIAVSVPPTQELVRVERGLRGILPGGSTALWDALYAGTLLASGTGRSLLVVFTDGEDNLSWLDAGEVRRVLEESNVLVQAVGIVPPPPPAQPGRTPPPPVESRYVRALRQMAEVTGGRFWPAASRDRLADAFSAILEEMKLRYILRFEPPQPNREGLHELDVRLVRGRGKIHCRRAYFVGPASR
jgi:Ca-activated chloride channel family protein